MAVERTAQDDVEGLTQLGQQPVRGPRDDKTLRDELYDVEMESQKALVSRTRSSFLQGTHDVVAVFLGRYWR